MSESPACTGCGLDQRQQPDLLMFTLGAGAICGRCIKKLAARVTESERRKVAADRLVEWKDKRRASLHDLISGMASSIRRDPQEWWTDGHYLYHGNGVWAWIANGRGSLRIMIPERGQFTLPFWQRRKLWRSVAFWRGRPLPEFWRYNPVRGSEGHRS